VIGLIGGNVKVMDNVDESVECSCYGCEIQRLRAGIRPPDRSSEPCSPPSACADHGRCWTHSEWIDMAVCDPLSACASGISCGAHGVVREVRP
jgi:hypothetical protein